MGAIVFRARCQLRSAWRSWVGLALVVGLAGGAVLAAGSAASRTDTAYGRFLASSHAADYHVYATPNPDTGQFSPERVARLSQVRESARMRYYASSAQGFVPVASPAERMHVPGRGIARAKGTRRRPATPTPA